MKRRLQTVLVVASCLACYACGGHIAEYTPKRREYKPPVVAPQKKIDASTNGSLMASTGLGASLFTDVRSFGVGDLITVRVVERNSAERSTETDLDRDSDFSTGFDVLGGLANLAKHNPTLDPSKILNQNTSSSHKGGGRTSRKDKISFLVTTSVRQVLPNGDLFVEGQRVVKVNEEEHHFYVSGVARPADVRTDNSISSTLLADAEVEFFGEGSLSTKAKQSWFMTALDWIWPF